MKKKVKDYKPAYLIIRYLILLGLTFSLPLIYLIFTPMTIYPSAKLLSLFYKIAIYENIIVINSTTFIQIIPACVAGSAYLLLLILNLSIPMKLKKRVQSILFSFILLLTINILRISVLSGWYHKNMLFFDFTHAFFWYVLSTIFVIFIWLLIIKIFSIKEIPFYTDFKYLINDIKK